MKCQQTNCEGQAKKHGRDRYGSQRWQCRECGKTWSEPREKLLGDLRVDEDKALMALHLLCEGSSIRSVARVTGLHKNSIMKLLVQVGQQCESFLAENVRDVPVEDVQCDELWSYVAMKQKTKNQKNSSDPEVGDAWTFLGIDRDSKLVLCWHLGQRTHQHTDTFIEKLDKATSGHFQITTDGMHSYPDSVNYHLGSRTDYAQLIKEYGTDSAEDQRRYSPAKIIGIEKIAVHGNPDEEKICTSHVERQNLTVRMAMRRFTRLTNAFSKKWENLRAAIALFIAWYNYCWMHSSIRMTPAMKAGIARKPWSVRELVEAVAG